MFNFVDRDTDNFTRKDDRKAENVVFIEVLQKLKNNRLRDVRNDNAQFNNNQSRIFPFVELILKFYGWLVWHIRNATDIFVVTMVTI